MTNGRAFDLFLFKNKHHPIMLAIAFTMSLEICDVFSGSSVILVFVPALSP